MNVEGADFCLIFFLSMGDLSSNTSEMLNGKCRLGHRFFRYSLELTRLLHLE